MLDALLGRLLEKPCMYQDEMILFLLDEFDVLVTQFSIGRALASVGWSKKTARRVATGTKRRLAGLLPPRSVRIPILPPDIYR